MQRKTLGVLVGLALFIVAAGPSGYRFLGKQNFGRLINGGGFGSASFASRTAQAIAVASRQLEDVRRPDVGGRVSGPALRPILAVYKDKLHEAGIDDVTLSMARQRIQQRIIYK